MRVLKIVMDDRKLKVRENADMVNVSTGSASTILHKKLDMKKIFSRWVPHMLTMEQKQQQINDSGRCWTLFTRNKQDFLSRFMTMYTTWIHPPFYTRVELAVEWCVAGESRLKCPKMQQSAGKVMASFFWDMHSTIYTDYFEMGKSINGNYYIEL